MATREGPDAMEIDDPSMGTPISDIAMNLGGIDVVIQKTGV